MTKSKSIALCAASAAGALTLTTVGIAPASADSSEPSSDLTSAVELFARKGKTTPTSESARLHADLDAISGGQRSAKAITSDSDYYVNDTHVDAYYDTYAVPGLIGSSLAVPRSDGSKVLAVGALDTYSDGYMTIPGAAALMIDTNGDADTDFMAMTPEAYMTLDSVYSTPIARKVAGNWVNTGYSAMWLRGDDYYGVALDWRALGLTNVRWTFGVIDSSGETDFAPDTFSSPIDLGSGQVVTPPPGSGSIQSAPAKVGAVSVRKHKRRTTLDWPNTAGARSYRIKVSTNGSKYKTWGAVGSSKVTIATKSGKRYRVAISAKNAAGFGLTRYKSFTAR
jgi:hypothetical protein